MGQKDYQQSLVVQQLLQIIEVPIPELIVCPTVREANGLAMSSRNMRLDRNRKRKGW